MANRLRADPSPPASDGVGAPGRARAVRAPSRVDPANLLGAPLRRLRADWRDPLLRNGYALIVNIGATSLLGFLYWLLAAHLYSRSTVGLGSAAINLMQLLAGIGGQLTVAAALTRFIPRAGAATTRLAVLSYCLAGGAGVLVSLLYFAGLALHLYPATIGHGWLLSLALGGSVTVWCVFALQDAVLTGIRQAVWIPIENGLYGIAKIVMLIALARVARTYGIFASWTVPALVALLPVNLLIFGRLLPRHVAGLRGEPAGVSFRSMSRFMGGDYLGTIFFMATGALMPALIVARLGATEAAYWAVSYIIVYALDLVTVNLGVALMVEGVTERSKLRAHTVAVVRRIAAIIVPAVVFLVLFAPQVLSVFGQAYSAKGSGLLRLLSLAVLARAVTSLWISLSRVERRVGVIAFWQGCTFVLVVGLAWWLMGRMGIDGVGVAYLASQAVVAACLLPSILRILSKPRAVPAAAE
jgi:O-antigen/teichoic acid export membrane protein